MVYVSSDICRRRLAPLLQKPSFSPPLLIEKRQKGANYSKSQKKNGRIPHGRKSQNPSESRAPEMGIKLKNRIALGAPLLSKKIGLLNALGKTAIRPAPYPKAAPQFCTKSTGEDGRAI